MAHWVLIATAGLLLLYTPTNTGTAIRSITLAVASAYTVVLWVVDRERPPLPPRLLVIAILSWATWSVLSLVWSINASYSLLQIKREVGYGLAVGAIFYYATSSWAIFRLWHALVLASFVVLSVLAIGMGIFGDGWDFDRWHGGAGDFATYLVMIFPMLWCPLVVTPPYAYPRWLAAGLGLPLLVACAVRTDSRILWPALAAVQLASFGLSLSRRQQPANTGRRALLANAMVLVVFVGFFLGTAYDRAERQYPPNTTVTETIVLDDRPKVWKAAIEHILAKPWLGYGFGRGILQPELRQELHNPLLGHAHNLWISTCLQTGLPGALLLAWIFALIAREYLRYAAAQDPGRVLLGLVGASLLAGVIVKNLTDDFFFGRSALLFWALNGMLLGLGSRLPKQSPDATPTATPSS